MHVSSVSDINWNYEIMLVPPSAYSDTKPP